MKQHLQQIHPLAWTIIVGTMFGRLVTSMSIPFLSIYLVQVLGASPTQTGITVAVSSLAGILISFYGGYISDKIGRKVIMLISVFSWACVFFGFAAAQELWVFFLVNMLNGICRAVFEPSSRALLSDVTPAKQKLLVFNLRYAAINLGVVFGPIIGLQLGSVQSKFPFIIAGIVYIVYGLVIFLQFTLHRSALPVHTDVTTPRLREALTTTGKDGVFVSVLIGTIFCIMAYGLFDSTLAQYLTMNTHFSNGKQLFSYMLSLNAVTVLVMQYPVVRIARRFSPLVPLILGNALLACSMMLFGLAGGIGLMSFSVVLFTIGEVLLASMMDMLIDRISKPELKGTYFGVIGFNNLGNVIAPVIGGLLLDEFGMQNGPAVFLPLGLIIALGIPFLLIAKKKLAARERDTVQVKERMDIA
ncbi:transporter [Bacillus sp. FJAT-27264]|uniref:MDR family MFS transporter n=1 Tax=Paenibacillus sp. (strain DSM 101736 / FJAT-27264) TaxID=1850362 RepID=UPI00080801CE|nr:MFS transporter [Bacillus sp. FJAT-27264]OBZ18091.1 transporter [Bacillus sp. FJAT-27264]